MYRNDFPPGGTPELKMLRTEVCTIEGNIRATSNQKLFQVMQVLKIAGGWTELPLPLQETPSQTLMNNRILLNICLNHPHGSMSRSHVNFQFRQSVPTAGLRLRRISLSIWFYHSTPFIITVGQLLLGFFLANIGHECVIRT